MKKLIFTILFSSLCVVCFAAPGDDNHMTAKEKAEYIKAWKLSHLQKRKEKYEEELNKVNTAVSALSKSAE